MLDQAGQRQEAKVIYENALRIESENPVALNNLAYIIAESAGGHILQKPFKASELLSAVDEMLLSNVGAIER